MDCTKIHSRGTLCTTLPRLFWGVELPLEFRGLPFMTSALEGGGGSWKSRWRYRRLRECDSDKGGEGVKNPRILRMLYMEGPLPPPSSPLSSHQRRKMSLSSRGGTPEHSTGQSNIIAIILENITRIETLLHSKWLHTRKYHWQLCERACETKVLKRFRALLFNLQCSTFNDFQLILIPRDKFSGDQ